jgi:hypothetical protein
VDLALAFGCSRFKYSLLIQGSGHLGTGVVRHRHVAVCEVPLCFFVIPTVLGSVQIVTGNRNLSLELFFGIQDGIHDGKVAFRPF